MNKTNLAIKIGIGALRFMAQVENMERSIEKRIEGPVPMCGANRLKAHDVEENLKNLCSAMGATVKIQSAIGSGGAAELDRILRDEHEEICSDTSFMSLGENASASSALKALHKIGQQTNSTLLSGMEALFQSFGSSGNQLEDGLTTSIAAKLQELGDSIDREMALINYFIADMSDPSMAM